MIDSAQLVDLDMNISFVRLLWKYDCGSASKRNGVYYLPKWNSQIAE
jgi:hypothetical protein